MITEFAKRITRGIDLGNLSGALKFLNVNLKIALEESPHVSALAIVLTKAINIIKIARVNNTNFQSVLEGLATIVKKILSVPMFCISGVGNIDSKDILLLEAVPCFSEVINDLRTKGLIQVSKQNIGDRSLENINAMEQSLFPLGSIPREIWSEHILPLLDNSAITNFARTCQLVNALCKDQLECYTLLRKNYSRNIFFLSERIARTVAVICDDTTLTSPLYAAKLFKRLCESFDSDKYSIAASIVPKVYPVDISEKVKDFFAQLIKNCDEENLPKLCYLDSMTLEGIHKNGQINKLIDCLENKNCTIECFTLLSNFELTDEIINVFRALQKNTSLQYLSYHFLDYFVAHNVLTILSTIPNLKLRYLNLEFFHHYGNDYDLGLSLTKVVRCCRELVTLNLQGIALGVPNSVSEFNAFLSAVNQLQHLKFLSIRGCFLHYDDSGCWHELATFLSGNVTLTGIDIAHNYLCFKNMQFILDSLRQNTTLSCICFVDIPDVISGATSDIYKVFAYFIIQHHIQLGRKIEISFRDFINNQGDIYNYSYVMLASRIKELDYYNFISAFPSFVRRLKIRLDELLNNNSSIKKWALSFFNRREANNIDVAIKQLKTTIEDLLAALDNLEIDGHDFRRNCVKAISDCRVTLYEKHDTYYQNNLKEFLDTHLYAVSPLVTDLIFAEVEYSAHHKPLL